MNSPLQTDRTGASKAPPSPSLRNSRVQLLRFEALYAADEEEDLNASTVSYSFDEIDEGEDDDDFLKEARASLRDLDEWQDYFAMTPDSDCDDSSCNASYNSSSHPRVAAGYPLNNTTESAWMSWCGLGYGQDEETTTERVVGHRSTSTLSSLKAMKDDDIWQRKRIAEAIAASSSKGRGSRSAVMSPARKSKSIGLQKYTNLFQNKENVENDSGLKEKHRRKHRHMRPFLIRSRQDKRDETMLSTTTTSSSTTTSNHFDADRIAGDRDLNVIPMSDQDLQLRRSVFGTARVLTMDGIVESFASTGDGKAISEFDSLHRGRHNSAPTTSDAPLTWV